MSPIGAGVTWKHTQQILAAALMLFFATSDFAAAQATRDPQHANVPCFEVVAPNSNGAIVSVLAIMVDRCSGQSWWLAPEVTANGLNGRFNWAPIGPGPGAMRSGDPHK